MINPHNNAVMRKSRYSELTEGSTVTIRFAIKGIKVYPDTGSDYRFLLYPIDDGFVNSRQMFTWCLGVFSLFRAASKRKAVQEGFLLMSNRLCYGEAKSTLWDSGCSERFSMRVV